MKLVDLPIHCSSSETINLLWDIEVGESKLKKGKSKPNKKIEKRIPNYNKI